MMESNKEYAQALYMIAAENSKVNEYKEHLDKIGQVFGENPGYAELLMSPAVPMAERLGLIEEAFGKTAPEYIVSFLKLLCENGHIDSVLACIEDFNDIVRMAENHVNAKVYYVEPLTERQKEALKKKLHGLLGKEVDAVYIKDESLIGGIKIDAEGTTIDGSIAKSLNRFKGVMSE